MNETVSDLQLQILQLLSQGCRTSEIAKRLSLSFKSIADEISSLKLQSKTGSTVALVDIARQQGLL